MNAYETSLLARQHRTRLEADARRHRQAATARRARRAEPISAPDRSGRRPRRLRWFRPVAGSTA